MPCLLYLFFKNSAFRRVYNVDEQVLRVKIRSDITELRHMTSCLNCKIHIKAVEPEKGSSNSRVV